MSSKDMDKLKKELTGYAIEVAKEFRIELNFSHKSIKRVEKILSKIHKNFKKTGDEDGLHGIALEFAAYIICVIEQHSSSGLWKRNHPKLGEETFPYEWNNKTIFPYGWCMKRIYDGKGDNVWSKYKAIVLSEID